VSKPDRLFGPGGHECDDSICQMVAQLSENDEEDRLESAPRRSIRIRLYNVNLGTTPGAQQVQEKDVTDIATQRKAESLKSPPSPRSTRLADYKISEPRDSVPPRPLVPKSPGRKTLVLDLDETLIHSLAKGGKMSAGHMVEVKFDQHAILYYVHKRPFCDRFLKKVITISE
jgi:CTD nuclear envelope phosphatase 1